MPRAWLTPDSPAPESERCRTISVPDDLAFVAAVTGALLPLTDPASWEEAGSMTASEAADIMSAAFELFVASECGGDCPECTVPGTDYPFIRRNPSTGATEQWDGDSWEEPSGDYAITPPEARTEETEEERLCAGAVSAAGVLKALYVAMLDFYETEVDPYLNYAEFALQAGLLIAAEFGNISAAYAALLEFAVSNFVAAMSELTVPMWSDKWQQTLICILKENETDSEGVVSFNWSGVMADLVGLIVPILDENLLVRWQTWYMVQFLGPEALNVAGTKDEYAGDCVECGNWYYTFDFTSEGSQEWVAIRETNAFYSAPGVFNGSSWVSTVAVDTSGGYSHKVMLGRQFDETTLTGIKVTYNRTNGQIVSQHIANRFYKNNWDLFVDTGSRTQIRSDNTPGATGTDLTLENTGTWSGANCVSISLSASNRAGAVPSPIGTIAVTRISLSGEGPCPFGASNCEELV